MSGFEWAYDSCVVECNRPAESVCKRRVWLVGGWDVSRARVVGTRRSEVAFVCGSCGKAVYHCSYVIAWVAKTFGFARGTKIATPVPYGIYLY